MTDLGGVLIATLLPVISIWLAAWPAYPITQNRARLRSLGRQFATVMARVNASVPWRTSDVTSFRAVSANADYS